MGNDSRLCTPESLLFVLFCLFVWTPRRLWADLLPSRRLVAFHRNARSHPSAGQGAGGEHGVSFAIISVSLASTSGKRSEEFGSGRVQWFARNQGVASPNAIAVGIS